jgi:hypothetical protein
MNENFEQVDKTIKVEDIKQKKMEIRKVPASALVNVLCNTHGGLLYLSKKTGVRYEWDEFGNEQQLPIEELVTMRNSQRRFFEDNWVVIDGFVDAEYQEFSDLEILDYLQVSKYYDNTLCPRNIDDVFSMSVAQIEEKVPNMSRGVKNTIILRANEFIKIGKLDSLRTIKALETALNCELSRSE